MNGLVFCKAFHSISESSIEPCITLSTRWLILGNIHFQDPCHPWKMVYLPTWIVDFYSKCRWLYHTWILWGMMSGGTSFLDNWNPRRTTSSMCDRWPVVTWDAHPIIDNSNDELWWYADGPNGGRTEIKRTQGVGYLFFFFRSCNLFCLTCLKNVIWGG